MSQERAIQPGMLLFQSFPPPIAHHQKFSDIFKGPLDLASCKDEASGLDDAELLNMEKVKPLFRHPQNPTLKKKLFASLLN